MARAYAKAPAKPHPKLPPYTAEWDTAVAALTDPLAGTLAAQRGFSMEFVLWLRERKLIGIVKRNGLGPALALPVHDEQGVVIAAHVRNRSTHTDGTPIDPPPPRWQYLYHGETSPGTRLLIIGDVKRATNLWVFESQWDAFAVMDRMGFHTMAMLPPAVAVVITRGASNGRLLQPFVGEGKSLILWPQNDPTGENGRSRATTQTRTTTRTRWRNGGMVDRRGGQSEASGGGQRVSRGADDSPKSRAVDARGRDERLVAEFGDDWKEGWNGLGLPNAPKPLRLFHPLLGDTQFKTSAILRDQSKAVRLGLLPPTSCEEMKARRRQRN